MKHFTNIRHLQGKPFFVDLLLTAIVALQLLVGCVSVGPLGNRDMPIAHIRRAISPSYEPLFLSRSVWVQNGVPFAMHGFSAIEGVLTIDTTYLYFLNWREDKDIYEVVLKREIKSFANSEHIKKRVNEFVYLKSKNQENFIFYVKDNQGIGISSEQTQVLQELISRVISQK